MSTPHRNIELKSRCQDLEAAAKAVGHLTPTPKDAGTLHQIDTYFFTPNGRLKLREIIGIKSELIWYDRPDRPELRNSNYRLAPVTDPASTKSALAAALGIRGIVEKKRHLLLWHNIRIHLDTVENLGTFIEFEAVMTEAESESLAQDRLATLCRTIGLVAADYCETSYADLMGLPRD